MPFLWSSVVLARASPAFTSLTDHHSTLCLLRFHLAVASVSRQALGSPKSLERSK